MQNMSIVICFQQSLCRFSFSSLTFLPLHHREVERHPSVTEPTESNSPRATPAFKDAGHGKVDSILKPALTDWTECAYLPTTTEQTVSDRWIKSIVESRSFLGFAMASDELSFVEDLRRCLFMFLRVLVRFTRLVSVWKCSSRAADDDSIFEVFALPLRLTSRASLLDANAIRWQTLVSTFLVIFRK